MLQVEKIIHPTLRLTDVFQDWHFVIELAPLVGSLEGPGRDRMDGDGNLITPTGKMHHTGQTVQDTELSSKFSTQSTYEKPWRWHAMGSGKGGRLRHGCTCWGTC